MLTDCVEEQMHISDLDSAYGKTFREPFPAANPKARTSASSWKNSSELCAIPYLSLDLTPGAGNLLGESYWEILSPWRGDASTLNTGKSPSDGTGCSLWQILEARPHPKYYLTQKACQGILRRATERGKPLPEQLRIALEIQAGVRKQEEKIQDVAFHINQCNEGIDLNGVSGALMATRNMQMQTFVTQQKDGIAFAQNQRDEVRNLHDVAGALSAQPGMKQQTYIAAPPKEQPVLCLNDQGGQFMNCSENITGTLRAQMNAHQPLILEDTPKIYENHGIASRYTGPHEVSPTLSARCGTGGNNVPLVDQREDIYCIVGNIIDRKPQNGGNGIGCQKDIAYTLTGMDKHAIYARQRVDEFRENNVVSTESARQHKDATDLVMQPYQETVGTLVRSDHKGIGNQYVNDDKCIVEGTNLIRRLTPLECERLQGFPDEWTNIPKASDSARYKALGNSVAIPCVEFIMSGIAQILKAENEKRRRRGWVIILAFLLLGGNGNVYTRCDLEPGHMWAVHHPAGGQP